MSLTQNETSVSNSSEEMADSISSDGVELRINESNPFKDHDYGIIIKAFEVEAQNWEEEDYALAYHYKDVYGTQNFSNRVREQMNYYPGMHQTNTAPEENPFLTEAEKNSQNTLNFWNTAMDNPDAFNNGLRSRQEDFDYASIFGSDASAEERAQEFGKMVTECIPCFDELLNMDQLLPSGDLLEIHAMNIKIRTDILDKIKTLFDDPGAYIDVCQLLDLFSHICPRQLLAMVAMLTQYLAKLNLDVKFNIDFIIQLVGPILSPFLDSLSQWLDMWIQVILKPIICIVDNINETILIAQSMQIPFSDVSGDVSLDLDIAAPGHQNISADQNIAGGATSGPGDRESGAGAWGSFQWEHFNTPQEEKYNPTIPEYPIEETQMAREEIAEAWSPSYSEVEREERDRRWADLRAKEEAKRKQVPPPLENPDRNGQRWSKDDIPNSEKHVTNGEFDAGYYPPEEQSRPTEAVKYFDASPLVNSIVQLRNILQGAVQYVEDWFTYVTQMIYDLLGTEVGWMAKKADNTMLKSRIIQMLQMVRAILRAIKRNGLQCGLDNSNFNQAQLQYILEEELNPNPSSVNFVVNNDGTITLTKPMANIEDTSSSTTSTTTTVTGATPDQQISEPETNKTKPVSSGIIIKTCFKNFSKADYDRTSKWIADFEKRGSI